MRLTPEQLALREAEREAYQEAAIKEYAKRVVAAAPPPTPAQRDQLMVLLHGWSRDRQTPEERRLAAEAHAEESWAKAIAKFRDRDRRRARA